MSQSLLRRRASLLGELRQIVSAMRNMSVAALQRLGKAEAVEHAAERLLAQALSDLATALPPPEGNEICLVIGSERGFCGGFNERIAAFAKTYVGTRPNIRYYVAGARLTPILQEAWPQLIALNGCADMEDTANTVTDWLSTLLPTTHNWPPLTLIFHDEAGVTQRLLLPLPPLPAPSSGCLPLHYLDEHPLKAGLITEWLRLKILSTLTRSLTVEHHCRFNQMQKADRYLEEAGIKLKGTIQRQRQNEITVELENLMSALDAG